MTSSALLSIDRLSVDFRTAGDPVRAVDELSFAVAAGEVVALVGESGSGKSVTARSVLGLLPTSAQVSGSVRLREEELVGLKDHELRRIRGARIAMVFQEPSTALNPVETVGWQIGEALRAHGSRSRSDRRREAVRLLGLVDLPDPEHAVDRYPHQLSGGQRQRVVIALALAGEPELLIADEPTTALDVTVQDEILRLLRSLRDRLGTAILLITHNMGVVADLADRVVVLHNGRLQEDGEVQQIFAAPAAAYTQQLLAAVPRLDAVRVGDSRSFAEASALEVSHLSAVYPARRGSREVQALTDVSFSMSAGEVLGLVGESGSGKSTIGRIVSGVMKPNGGQCRVLGEDIATLSRADLRALRRRIGVVYQDPAASLDPLLTLGESIAEPLMIHKVASGAELRDTVINLLDAVQLPAHFADRRPANCSGGQRQRAALARSLALGPELLIADEPTSALDVSIQARVLALFRELQTRLGFACLFISHDLAVIDEVSDHVVVLRQGELVEHGRPATVLRDPHADYTRRLIDAVPLPDPVAQGRRRAQRDLMRSNDGLESAAARDRTATAVLE